MSQDTFNITANGNSKVIAKADQQSGFYEFMLQNRKDYENQEKSKTERLSNVLPQRKRGKHVTPHAKSGSFRNRGRNPLKTATKQLTQSVNAAEKERNKRMELSNRMTAVLRDLYKESSFSCEWDQNSFDEVFNCVIEQLKANHGSSWYENSDICDEICLGSKKEEWLKCIRKRKIEALNRHIPNSLSSSSNGSNENNGNYNFGGTQSNSGAMQQQLQRLTDRSGQYQCVRGSMMYDQGVKNALKQLANNPQESSLVSAFLNE